MFDKRNSEEKAYIQAVNESRRRKDGFFGSSPQSPIPFDERRRGFGSLRYYPPNPTYRVEAEVLPFQRQEIVQLGTTTGEIRPQVRYAELRFRINGRPLRLTGFLDPDYQEHHHGHDHGIELFIPFRDASSGIETYGAGRYLEAQVVRAPDGSEVATLDFNMAYNPYCAYNPDYSCPLPPAENTLPEPIPAGERTYGTGH